MAKVYENVFQYGDYGKQIAIREYDTITKEITWKYIQENEYIPEIYCETKLEGFQPSGFVSFENQNPLFVKYFKRMSDLQRLVNPTKMTDEEKELRNKEKEGVISPEDQKRLKFLQDFRKNKNKEAQKDFYGNVNKVQNVIREFYQNPVEHDHDMHIIYLDIETDSGTIQTREGKTYTGFPESKDAYFPIILIQIYDTKTKKFIIWGYQEWNGNFHGFENAEYIKCNNEKDMLENFISYIEKDYPAAFYGFNSLAFDYPYIINRIRYDYPELNVTRLSPVGEIKYDVRMSTQDDYDYLGVEIKGVHLMDLRDLVLKYAYLSLPNYSLDTIAEEGYDLEGKHKHKAFEYLDFRSSWTGKNISINMKDPDHVPDEDKEIWESVMNRKLIEKELEKRGLK